MNSICLSVAPNLRCQELTRVENILLVVPPALELVFSLTLAVTSAPLDGKKRWLLVLDGLSFFLLAVTDLLAHVIPKVASTVHIFSLIDTVLAAASFTPLLFYTVFLFLFARASLVSVLPARFSRITSLSLLAAIPPTLATNELASLLGLTHTSIPARNHAPIVVVSFTTRFLQHVTLFFSAASLALLTLFQAILFALAFFRLARAFVDERRIESAKHDPHAREEIHLFRGLGWLAVGLKLGAIETVVGFANISFAIAVTRRVLRLFARGTLIIGVIKGLNILEDFSSLESDLRARSRVRRVSNRFSRRLSRFMISNPRNSTLQELSPRASSFHAAQLAKREKRPRLGPSPLTLGDESTLAKFNETQSKGAEFDSPGFDGTSFNIPRPRSGATRNQRVTVQYDGQTPPVLQLRFSMLDMDVPALPLSPHNRAGNHNLPSHGQDHGLDSSEKPPLPIVAKDPREGHVSLPERDWDQHLFYGYIPRTPAASTTPQAIPPGPPGHPRRVSHAAPSFTSNVPMPSRDTPRASHISHRSSPFISQDVPRSPEDTPRPSHDTAGTLRRSARTVSAASDSLDAVREIAARFPGLPPRVVPGKSTTPSRTTQSAAGGGADADTDADSDTEWRALSRARSLKRRREMEVQQAEARSASRGGADVANAAAGSGTDISPVNSIKRKPAPALSLNETRAEDAQARADDVEAQVSQGVIARAAVTAAYAARAANGHGHGQSPSLDDLSSCYSSSDDDGDTEYGYIGAHNLGTPGPETPATTAASVTPGPVTPASWLGGDERHAGRLAGRVKAVGRGEDSDVYPNAQAQAQQPKSQPQDPKPHAHSQPRQGTLEERRLRRLTLLRRELRASARDSATASAALEPELQAPWLHADPLTQLQTIGTGVHVGGDEDEDEDEDAVLDDAWRRAGLTRIKTVSRVRVHTTPRVEQGFEVRGSLVAVEEEEEEDLGVPMSPEEDMRERERRTSGSTLRRPARLDSGVLGEEERRLVQQGIRV